MFAGYIQIGCVVIAAVLGVISSTCVEVAPPFEQLYQSRLVVHSSHTTTLRLIVWAYVVILPLLTVGIVFPWVSRVAVGKCGQALAKTLWRVMLVGKYSLLVQVKLYGLLLMGGGFGRLLGVLWQNQFNMGHMLLPVLGISLYTGVKMCSSRVRSMGGEKPPEEEGVKPD